MPMLRDQEQNPSVRSGWLKKGIVNIKRAEKKKQNKTKTKLLKTS